jgi:mRNA-degrading endonuclease RelE of RelBE toxin-antitoxin system
VGSFTIDVRAAAEKELSKLPRQSVKKIVEMIEELSNNPFPVNAAKLVG